MWQVSPPRWKSEGKEKQGGKPSGCKTLIYNVCGFFKKGGSFKLMAFIQQVSNILNTHTWVVILVCPVVKILFSDKLLNLPKTKFEK